MALTKQQKMDMIRDVELRLAKEELAEQHIKNMKTIEDREKPLRTLKGIVGKDTPPAVEVEHVRLVAGQDLSEHQREEWHSLNERQFEELETLTPNADLKEFAAQKHEELEHLLSRHGRDRDRVEKSETPLEEEQAILLSYKNTPDPQSMARMKQNINHLTTEEKELLEQSEEATKTPFKKDGLDSKTQWEFIGFETLAVKGAENRNLNIQKDFENAQSMTNDHDMGMEL